MFKTAPHHEHNAEASSDDAGLLKSGLGESRFCQARLIESLR